MGLGQAEPTGGDQGMPAGEVTPFSRLAKAILWRAAQDMRPEQGTRWLDSDSCRIMCEQSGVDYGDFFSAMRYIMSTSDIQRSILLQKLKVNIGA